MNMLYSHEENDSLYALMIAINGNELVMVMNLYSAFSIGIFKCALQASDLWVRSDIRERFRKK